MFVKMHKNTENSLKNQNKTVNLINRKVSNEQTENKSDDIDFSMMLLLEKQEQKTELRNPDEARKSLDFVG